MVGNILISPQNFFQLLPKNLFDIVNTYKLTTIKYTIVIFLKKNLNHISDLFENNGYMRSWGDLREKLGVDDNKILYWRQILPEIPCAWKEMLLECSDNISDLIIKEHDFIKKHQNYCLEKLNSR